MRSITLLLICLFNYLAVTGQPLFTQVDAAQSNIHFNNKIEDKRNHNILLYSNYYGGAGLAIADFDNDGLKDIYFAGNLVNDVLYKNTGDLTFKDVSDEAGIKNNGAWSSSVLTADINNDGLLDIYVTCELYDEKADLRKNKLYINQGQMKFKEMADAYGIADSERTRGGTFIDYDKDGWLDLFILNQPPNPGNYSPFSGQNLLREEWSPRLYKNIEGKQFKNVTRKAGVLKACYPNAVIAADFDKDGWQDLYVSNDYEAPDFLYHNNQDGTFTNIIDDAMQHLSYYSMGVDAADIDNDGRLDLMTLDMVAEDNFRLKSNMGSMKPDLFWKLVNQGAHYQYMFNALHWNRGDMVFSEIAQMAGVSSTDWSWSNLIADFDNDGWKDIYITNGLLRDIRNSDMAKTFPEYVKKTIDVYLKEHPNEGEVHILDILDLQEGLNMHPSVPLNNYAYKNNGDLTFSKVNEEWGVSIPSFSNGSAYGDLDNDGDLDLVVNNINTAAFLFKNNSNVRNNSNYLRIFLTDNTSNFPVQGAKIEIEHNGKFQFSELTNTRGMYSSSENYFHFGLGEDEIVELITVTWPDGNKTILNTVKANQVLTIDYIEAERKPSLIVETKPLLIEDNPISVGIDYIHSENEFDDYDRQILLPHEMSHQGPALGVSDVNGDGLDDIYLGGASGQSATLYLQGKDGKFKIGFKFNAADAIFEDVDAIFFDADDDGDRDLYVVSGGNAFPPRNKNYLDRFYLNDGKGNFKKADNFPRILESGSCVRSADFDGDGDLDLFVGGRHNPWDYPSPSISRLLENQDGNFIDVTKSKGRDLINIGMVTDARWSDFDEDGLLDLVIVGEWMPITFLKNMGANFKFLPRAIKENNINMNSNGWWSAITVFDIDQDGDDDYILGNLGTNYKYKASQSEPFEVHYGDFDGNKHKDIVLSYYNFGEQFPLRGRSCSSAQIPSLKNTFPSYDVFAGSNLSDVYAPEALKKALNYKAHQFKSGYLLNNEDGFTFKAFSNESQISTVNSILVADFNNDQSKDILLAGNMYQSEIETTRNDANIGQLLIQNSSKQFLPFSKDKSGLNLADDVRKIRRLKIQNQNYLLITINNQRPKLFKY